MFSYFKNYVFTVFYINFSQLHILFDSKKYLSNLIYEMSIYRKIDLFTCIKLGLIYLYKARFISMSYMVSPPQIPFQQFTISVLKLIPTMGSVTSC